MVLSSISNKPPISWLPFIGKRVPAPMVPVLRLSGVISTGSRLRRGLNLALLAPLIERAFSMRRASAVALVINSPGGSAAQSALICERIRTLAAEKEKPVYAFAEDVAASGGYWLACAADEIYANENSIIGSIGVIYGGFGFQDALAKLGVERRLHTSGHKKSMLDPFSPQQEADVKRLKSLQKELHRNFISLVRDRRGDRLNGTARRLFSGEFWTGSTAVDLGLVDGIGDVRQVMREKFGDNVKLRPLKSRLGWLPITSNRAGLARTRGIGQISATGSDIADDVMGAVEERLLWSRYGL